MSVKSFLSNVGHAFAKVGKVIAGDLNKVVNVAVKIEPDVEKLVALASPQVAAIMHTTTALILAEQQKYAAIAAESGSGVQKLDNVSSAIFSSIQAFYAQFDKGHTVDLSHAQGFVQKIVEALQILPPIIDNLSPATPSSVTTPGPAPAKPAAAAGAPSVGTG